MSTSFFLLRFFKASKLKEQKTCISEVLRIIKLPFYRNKGGVLHWLHKSFSDHLKLLWQNSRERDSKNNKKEKTKKGKGKRYWYVSSPLDQLCIPQDKRRETITMSLQALYLDFQRETMKIKRERESKGTKTSAENSCQLIDIFRKIKCP